MSELALPEKTIFAIVLALYVVAAMAGVRQLMAGGEKYKRFLLPLVSLAVTLEAVLLVFRAAALKALPLTGLFESMIVLTIVFGLVYICLSIVTPQVWFGSVMVWVTLVVVLLAGVVAGPTSEPHPVARKPWAIAHGVAMILGGASVMLATASALLYLVGSRRLKKKQVLQVLGRVPNMQKLEQMTLFGIRVGFMLITIGLISGIGLVALLGTGVLEWLADPKVLCITVAWALLGMMLVLNHLSLLKSRARAYITVVVFVLLLFAILGVAILGATRHDFSSHSPPTAANTRYV
ncbi:MAG: cytochrome c biogenesis protein CcsA [Phycisphaerales bacterium]|nr:MAG: cytochrome c biogenesis protein CcsA [Phycisphaerales bacterium]